ncbi:hypothetical protein DFH07DRAFT_262287 [Mycena maculata]|uniref:Uncharacterized protein n=1 Tax=Mycena maculata TaxID=230809 RepID=A0AAD7HPX3_9AGAR|nr:hypothetical protein DFH07DRAFT_262287 [Mycena maculata]
MTSQALEEEDWTPAFLIASSEAGSDYEANPSQRLEREIVMARRDKRKDDARRLAAGSKPDEEDSWSTADTVDSDPNSENEMPGPAEGHQTAARHASRQAAEDETITSSPTRKRPSTFEQLSALQTNIPSFNPDESTQDFITELDRSRELRALADHDLLARCLQAETDRDKYRGDLIVALEALNKAELDITLWRSAGNNAQRVLQLAAETLG